MKKQRISDQVRKFIRSAGVTEYQIAKASGVGRHSLYRFMSGERDLSLKNLDKLGECLEFEIRRKGKKHG